MNEVIKGDYGECVFVDCRKGLASLIESYDLCLSDFPHNHKMNLLYEDSSVVKGADYFNEIFKIYELLREKSRSIIFTCGKKNHTSWLEEYNDLTSIYWRSDYSSELFTPEPVLCKNTSFKEGYEINYEYEPVTGYVYPFPIPLHVLESIINEVNPSSVLDPFMGSGGVAEVCEARGIKWLGFEINKAYTNDVRKRIKKGADKFLL